MITHGKPEARGWGGSMRVAADVALTEYFTDIYFLVSVTSHSSNCSVHKFGIKPIRQTRHSSSVSQSIPVHRLLE